MEFGPSFERKFQFVSVPNLEDQNLVVCVAKMRERLEQLRHIAETIGKNNQQTTPMEFRDQIVKDVTQLCLTTGFAALQLINQHSKVADPRSWRDVLADRGVEGHQAYGVLLL